MVAWEEHGSISIFWHSLNASSEEDLNWGLLFIVSQENLESLSTPDRHNEMWMELFESKK